MESVFGRYRNLVILVFALFLQVIALGVQVHRTTDTEPTRLIRVWVAAAVTPLEKAIVWVQSGSASLWHNYFYLRGVRQENRDLKAEIQRLRLEQVRLSQDAEQARRLQTLLGFREQYISKTVPAQVIGSSGSEQSRVIYIDKDARDGVKAGDAVITVDGIVGKVSRVLAGTSQVLLINDQTSGVGALLSKSRLQGVLRGTPAGEVILEKVMSDETVQAGENVVTSGGDRIFPKGLPVGVVTRVSQGPDLFLNIRVKPAANLSKLEEVLVVTNVQEMEPSQEQTGPVRAIDILAERLPSVPQKPAQDPNKPPVVGSAAVPANTKPGISANANINAKPGDAGSAAKPGQSPLGAKPQPATAQASTPSVAASSKENSNSSALGDASIPKPHVEPASNKPAASSANDTSKNSGPAVVKPATGQKAAPPAVKVSEKTLTTGSAAQPAGSAAKPVGGQTKPAGGAANSPVKLKPQPVTQPTAQPTTPETPPQ